MARGGRGYAAVPAGDGHTPRRSDERRVDTEDDGADAEHDRAQLTGGVARSDQVESDSDSEEEAATRQRESVAPSTSTSTAAPSTTTTASADAAVVVAEAERPQEERVDRKEEHRDDNNSDNNNDNQHTESASSAAEASAPAAEEAADEEPLEPGAIRIRILDLNGKFFSIVCQLDWRVARLKDKVHEAADVAVAAQRLIYRGRVLEDDKVLDDYKLEDGHTVHLFVRMNATPEPEPAAAEAATSGANAPTLARFGDDGVTIVHITSETISSAVFPSDSARRVDPLMLDSPLGNCARRVKLWSSFLLIIYTMKVMGQFALLANDQQMRQEQNSAKDDSNGQDRYYDRYDYPPYYNQDPMVSALELMVHAFGVYVGCVGFKAAHDTDIRPIRFYCRGIVWLAFLTVVEQMYVTYQISQSDYPETRIQYPYGPAAPSKDDIISANVFQTIMLVVMWIIAIAHSYAHQAEVARYNESFAAAAMNAVPPAHLPENVV